MATIVLTALAVTGGAAWAGVAWLRSAIDSPLAITSSQHFEVPAGASAVAIANRLAENGWLASPRPWAWYARWTGKADQLKAGYYELSPGETGRMLLDEIVAGRVMLEQVTVIEGWTYRDLRRLLALAPGVRQSLAGVSDDAVMSTLGSPGVHPEGQFFPDTYRFAHGTADLEILRIAHERLRSELAEAWAGRVPVARVKTPYDALILASIVEKESSRADERSKIAGVYVKRLQIGMRLQADPTVIYGLGESYDGDLRTRDMHADNRYNTYTRAGLPPTPIALPGRGALLAAAQPEVTGALFFVATGRADGSHYFSSTLAEHNAAVRRLGNQLKSRAGAK
ncbi:MAG TPA: endolytic transglycosylase MltG [Steroidobacteraceae bacterium]|nr:endolytic transglycosylase MltG [Steroidobacteraceae bacterium]